jgi:ComF family protein
VYGNVPVRDIPPCSLIERWRRWAIVVYSSHRRQLGDDLAGDTVRCAFCSQSDPLTLEVPSSETSAWRAVARHHRSRHTLLSASFRSPLDDLSSVLFPSSCRVCGNPLLRLSRAPICDDCWKGLASQPGEVCFVCSEELRITAFTPVGGVGGDPAERLCQPCRLAPPAFARAVAFGGYAGSLRSMVHALKYDGILSVAARLGDLLAEAILKLEVTGDPTTWQDAVVVAVPMHAGKLKQRGFNHAELLARAAMKALRSRRPDWKLKLTVGVLERSRATASQAGLSPHQRRANLRGVFVVRRPELVAGRHVLLIDDIYTTGATARACSSVLRRAGAASVRVATVARPQRENFVPTKFTDEELPMHEDVAFWGSSEGPKNLETPVSQLATAANHPSIPSSILHWGRHVFGQRQH